MLSKVPQIKSTQMRVIPFVFERLKTTCYRSLINSIMSKFILSVTIILSLSCQAFGQFGFGFGPSSNEDDPGCVTNEGRPGTCMASVSCSMVNDTSVLPTCSSPPLIPLKYVCCPNSNTPGVYPRSPQGK